jgi:hypothetical protein
MIRLLQYIRSRRRSTSFILAAIGTLCLVYWACGTPDPRTIRGALDAAAQALEARDARALFRIIDQRARSAMASVVRDRREAARLVTSDYPEPERSATLASLGDAPAAQDAEGLFAQRCTEPCMAELAANVGAPVGETPEQNGDVQVRTSRGSLRMHHGKDRWWGIVWNTTELDAERTRAARELLQIEENAAVYRRRRALEGGGRMQQEGGKTGR